MIRLEELHGDKGAKQKRRRIGRGESSGWGKTAGKGHKGAQARSGAAKGNGFEGGQTRLARRLPKRGFSNERWATKTSIVNLTQISRCEESATVNFDVLAAMGLISKNTERIKVLGNGDLEKKLVIEADAFSDSARKKIEAAGGTCTIVESKKKNSKQDEAKAAE